MYCLDGMSDRILGVEVLRWWLLDDGFAGETSLGKNINTKTICLGDKAVFGWLLLEDLVFRCHSSPRF